MRARSRSVVVGVGQLDGSVSSAEQGERNEASGKWEPVRGQSVAERRDQSLCGADPRQYQHATQARFHDPEPAGCDRNECDDSGRRIRQQHERGAGVAANGPQDAEQAEVVEPEPARDEEDGSAPLTTECAADLVPLLKEARIQTRE